MPKANKHGRGRRGEKNLKRKRDDDEETTPEPKRPKPQDPSANDEDEESFAPRPLSAEEGTEMATERPYYGMLEDEEQEYFRRADELLELNDFPSDEERSLFLASVYREAENKELKIACSQSCSRLMERLILLSTVEQKKQLFEKFAGEFANLVQHRFASHCCEALFIQSAPVVTEELMADPMETDDENDIKSMEGLFLSTLDELEGHLATLLTDRFASHCLRALLFILSGRALEKSSTRSLLRSKKKEHVSVNNHDNTPTGLSLNKRAVPWRFQNAVQMLISHTIDIMDPPFVRLLATHPTGNPSLQLLLELELTDPNSRKGSNASQRTIISTLLPDDIEAHNSESAAFINGLLYDTIGSHLLETIVTHAPGKLFKQIYREIFEIRIASLARSEIASYVVIRVLNRISKEDLLEAIERIKPHISDFVKRSRVTVIKTLLERCHAREADTADLTDMIDLAYGADPSTLVLKMACIDDIHYLSSQLLLSSPFADPKSDSEAAAAPPNPAPKATPQQLHGSLLAQSMLAIPGPPCTLIQESLLAMHPQTLITLSLWPSTSHILQTSLTPISNSFSTTPTRASNLTFRRKLLNTLLSAHDAVPTLALSPVGTHVLDSILVSAPTLLSLIERIALTLAALEPRLRDSHAGRIVWRNWSMDLWGRKRGDWVKKVQGLLLQGGKGSGSSYGYGFGGEGASGDKEANGKGGKGMGKGKAKVEERKKTGIELAREKFAQNKSKKGTGANKIAV